MIPCPHCTSSQLPNTLFCNQCGTALSAPRPTPGAPAESISLRCEILDERRAIVLPDQASLIFGRGSRETGNPPDVDLGPFGGDERGVSRQHARLLRQAGRLYIEDLDSMNGTFVNEWRVRPRELIPIRAGDVIRMGLLRLRLQEGR